MYKMYSESILTTDTGGLLYRANQATTSSCLQCGTCNQALSLSSPPHKKQPWGLEPVRPGLWQKDCQSCCIPFQLTCSSLAVHRFQTTSRVSKPRKQILNCVQQKLISRQPSSQGSNCSTSLPHSSSLKWSHGSSPKYTNYCFPPTTPLYTSQSTSSMMALIS